MSKETLEKLSQTGSSKQSARFYEVALHNLSAFEAET